MLGNEWGHATACGPMRCRSHSLLPRASGPCASGGPMTKPTKGKRSESEVVSEVMLRRAALAYAAVAHLDPSDPRWRRCWRALSVAAIGMTAEIRKAGEPPPSRALVSRLRR